MAKSVCEKLVEDLATGKYLVVSGLAFGIDTIAHKASLKNNLQPLVCWRMAWTEFILRKIKPSQSK